MVRALALVLMVCGLCGSAHADVKSATEQGFEVARAVIVKASPAEVYALLGKPALWWSSDHTYSGDARNLKLTMRVGGCYCEVIPKGRGQVEHGRVIYLQPGVLLRLSTALGPLQGEGIAGVLTWSLKPVDGGTQITQNYAAGGYIRSGPKVMAPLVDRVLSEQLDRLKVRLELSRM